MRFAAPNPINVNLRSPIEEPDPMNPRRHVITRPGLRAQFVTSDFTDREKQVVIDRFKFNGIPVDEFSQLPIDPSYRISTFDTLEQKWNDEDREFAETFLLNHPQHGSDFIYVEPIRLQAPWQGYDGLPADKIPSLVEQTGVDVEDVIAYERENKNRKTLIAALEEMLVPEDDEVVVSA